MKIDIKYNKQTPNSLPGVCIKYPWSLEEKQIDKNNKIKWRKKLKVYYHYISIRIKHY